MADVEAQWDVVKADPVVQPLVLAAAALPIVGLAAVRGPRCILVNSRARLYTTEAQRIYSSVKGRAVDPQIASLFQQNGTNKTYYLLFPLFEHVARQTDVGGQP